MYKIYALFCPITNELKYIGLTSNVRVADRLACHLSEAKKKKGHKNKRLAWLTGLLNKNLKPKIEIIEELENREQANERETFWIAHYREKGFDLKNTQPGGEGNPKGFKFKKRYVAPKGILPPQFKAWHDKGGCKGRKKSKEELERFSKSNKGKPKYHLRKHIVVEDVLLNTVTEYVGQKEIVEKYGIRKSCLSSYLTKKKNKYFNNRYNFYFPNERTELSFDRVIIAVNSLAKLSFNTIVACAKHFNVKRNTVYRALKEKVLLKGFELCLID